MTTSNFPTTTLNPQQFADFLKTSLDNATGLYSRASGLQGITPSQLASARANMEESRRQYDAALAAIPVTSNLTSGNASGALSALTPAGGAPTTAATGALPTASGALSPATGASPSTAGGVTAAPATGSVTAAPASGALPTATGSLTGGQPTTSATATPAADTRDIGAMLSANALADNNLTYDQLLTLLRNNNITIDQAAPFLGDATTRAGLVSSLKNYQKAYDAERETFSPNSVNMYAINQAEELARDGQRVDFTNQNRATQIEAWKRGLFNTSELLAGGTSAMRSYYGARPVYLTSGITGANQGVTGNPLISTLQTAIQDPGSMGANLKAAVRAYQDPTGKVIATPSQIAAADAYVKRLTGDPNATYARTLRELDERGGGFMYDEQRLLGDVKNKLISGLDANLSIAKWDPATRGEIFAQKINGLGVSPSFAAAALGVTENDIFKLAGGDPTLWNKLAVNELIPTRPVVEGTSYRYGNAATVSGSNANTALTASQPTNAGTILPRQELFPQPGTGNNLVNPESVRVGTKIVYTNPITRLPYSEQVAKYKELGVKASDLIAGGFNTNYVSELVSQGLPR